jgi:bifunctional UDP-N-acetylglucosamine pyrophosphorylase/glucosamine-1-phosphate N-acetyltransferase
MKSRLEKVLHPIAGKPMLGYVLDTAKALKASAISVVLAPGMKTVEEEVRRTSPKAKIGLQKSQLGTGDAVKAARRHMAAAPGITFIMYGDTPFICHRTLEQMKEVMAADAEVAVTVLGFTPKEPCEYGRLVTGGGRLKSIVEYKDASVAEREIRLCNSGVMAVRSELLFPLLDKVTNKNAKKEYYLTDLVAIARDEGFACAVVEAEEKQVMGINNQAELAKAERLMQRELRRRAMENGARLISPENTFLRADTQLSPHVVIHPFVVFGEGVTVEEGVEIRSFCHIEKAVIRKNAIVGPFARIRPGAEVGVDAHIGNFVEIKNTKVGKGAKINHLSYVGDAEVGAGSNIGAGTITCNYDGFHKYKTVIGEEAFIGSNTSLIAPVKVGKGAIIGAGTTVMKDVPADSLAINEMPQKNLVGRARTLRRLKARKKK